MGLTKTFGEKVNNTPVLTNGYCTFNGTKSINDRKKKLNKKYYVYNQESGKVVELAEHEPLTVLQSMNLRSIRTKQGNAIQEKIIFYVDSKRKLAFVKTRQKQFGKYIDKIEKTPALRGTVLLVLFHFLFFGIMRFQNYSFRQTFLSFGYDKSVNVKLNFIFPKTIREKFAFKTGKITMLFHAYWCWIPVKMLYQHYLETSSINIPVYIKLEHEEHSYWYNLKSASKHNYDKKHYLYNTLSCRLRKMNSELFVRKSITGQYVIVVTSILSKWIAIKELFAFLLHLIISNKEKYDIYFEKFSMGASESAFELFKYAYNKGDVCLYILDKDHVKFQELKKKYGKSVVAKNSFLAFLYIFLARSFLSSDLVSHIQRRLYDNDYLVKRKVLNTNKKIMLQHGPCMATNIFERGYFNRKVPIAPDYMLVNSKFEKDLFLKNTSYTEKEIMVTGLPNLDLYVQEQNNQKKEVTFMLTWRPWDLTGSIEAGSYLDRYLSFIELIRKEPFYLDKKVNVVLHPKSKIILQEQFPDIYKKYEPYFFVGDIKDALLSSKVVISDYSSITFYAYAGGSNVIFYWEDKELAEKEYGSPNTLQKNIVFGDIVEEFNELNSKIIENYARPQLSFHKAQFAKLMECTDGQNTKNTYDFIHKNIFNELSSPNDIELSSEQSFSA
ncbi:CDP-glycerol glycerophosphotransferase family protein [Fictibacillus fluitans]|uniref:CDP-glycerol glycerophosphotransferase family protein n=1 Tax=Fictibacillus fluitans TaxID=3058422 RepID=A0ABT8HTQ7_9BACL|nr:CDP-glycerol glycerophosphotransferase family protein [Fictibacillus sp. NE201]MDN4524167.1 CDP-glycerol glycerophosphotransferase family protein [Fictibacillus sp. NE201]